MGKDVQVISRIAKILNVIVETGAASLKELSDTTGLPVSTTYRLLNSMLQEGFVERDLATKEYFLGPSFLRMATFAKPRRDIASVLRPVLQDLSSKTTEDSALAVLVDDTAVIVDQINGSHALKIIDKLNRPEILYVGAF